MPELPEVETVVRDLRPLVRGRQITALSASAKRLRSPWRGEWTDQVVGRRISNVRRRGKWIIVDFRGGDHLLAHLGMTGQFQVAKSSVPREPHTHLIFHLGERLELRFTDIRRFGSVRFIEETDDIDNLLGGKLGPEPWDVVSEKWHAAVRRSRRSLKAILLDQTMIAGVGNIYADESLFLARLPPGQRGDKTTREQAERLQQAIVRVLDQAIAARGSTIRNYVGGSGLRGGYQVKLLVYGRSGEPCSNCGALIKCRRLAGRSTHWCPQCQTQDRRRTRK
jgi:formamidopyrimidine-DNA glycosylase